MDVGLTANLHDEGIAPQAGKGASQITQVRATLNRYIDFIETGLQSGPNRGGDLSERRHPEVGYPKVRRHGGLPEPHSEVAAFQSLHRSNESSVDRSGDAVSLSQPYDRTVDEVDFGGTTVLQVDTEG